MPVRRKRPVDTGISNTYETRLRLLMINEIADNGTGIFQDFQVDGSKRVIRSGSE